METLNREFAAFVAELQMEAVAAELRGCSAVEIQELERVCGCRIPRAYRLYLELMGHASGRLFTHDHLAVTYEYVLRLGDELRLEMSRGSAWHAPNAPTFTLPRNALVILGRLSDYFQYITCDDTEDSPVFDVDSWNRVPKRVFPSILSWLRAHFADAVYATRSGYFDEHPNGTVP